MNAGRDVEQVIANWLVDEAAGPSPDRLLESSRQAVYRTNQRRFAAIWREPMFSPLRWGAIAATLVVALGAAYVIGRSTGTSGPGTPVPTPTASVAGATLETYRAAHDAVCIKYRPLINPLKPVLEGLYEPTLPAADRAAKVQTLADIGVELGHMADELEALEPPASAARDHVTSIFNLRQTVRMIQQAVASVGTGDLAGGQALDFATDPLSADIGAFETKYSLAACP